MLLDGQSLKGLKPSEIVRRGIGFSPEGRRVFPSLTVLENLRTGALHAPAEGAERDDRAHLRLLSRGSKERARQRAGSLSGGEQQMLAIGRALMSRPSIFLLDEPSLGLAPVIVERIGDILQEIQREQGLSILLAEQNSVVGPSLAHRAVIVELGRVTLTGAAAELAQDPEVRSAYLGI